MAIEVFMKVARAAAAHSNLHFLRRAIYPSSRVTESVILSGASFACLPQAGAAKDLNLKVVQDFDAEFLRLSLSDSLPPTAGRQDDTFVACGCRCEIVERELSLRESCDTLTAVSAKHFAALNRFKPAREN